MKIFKELEIKSNRSTSTTVLVQYYNGTSSTTSCLVVVLYYYMYTISSRGTISVTILLLLSHNYT